MFKNIPLLNTQLAEAIAGALHGDKIVIADAGLPIPAGVPVIDLALVRGVPSFRQVLEAVATAMAIERVTIATETRAVNPDALEAIDEYCKGINVVEAGDHAAFKRLTEDASVIIRTGECTPYANVILSADVVDDFRTKRASAGHPDRAA